MRCLSFPSCGVCLLISCPPLLYRDEVGTAAFVAMVGRVKTPMWIKELSHFDEIEIFKEIAVSTLYI